VVELICEVNVAPRIDGEAAGKFELGRSGWPVIPSETGGTSAAYGRDDSAGGVDAPDSVA